VEGLLEELVLMIADSLRALLVNIVDYAGLYPPASLPLAEVVANYRRYRDSADAWMLNRLVLPQDKLANAGFESDWRVTLLVDAEPGPLPEQVETLETRGVRRLSLPTYCEAPLDDVVDGYGKIRASGVSTGDLAAFIRAAACRRLPFKATAGLHHPLRTPSQHGFLNAFIGAAFAWLGMDRATLGQLLDDQDCHAFQFRNDGIAWREWFVSTPDIQHARREFAHSIGSCSFEEPVGDLRAMKLIP
jgi:hypothetical protein